MLINDTHRFAFVHIPKCAGTTVRNAMAPYDEHRGRFYDRAVADHSALGMLDHHHIPLSVLQDHFPEDFAKLRTYRSFAILRDPYSRFPSSLHERFVQRDRRPLSERDKGEVAREVDKVLALLARHPSNEPILDPTLIHFSRQRDYIMLGDEQIVSRPYVIAHVDQMLGEISDLVGEQVRPEESKNRRLVYRNRAIEKLQLAVTRPIEQILPRRIWKPAFKPIKAAFQATGILQAGGNPLSTLENADDIRAFVTDFYAEDIALYRRFAGKADEAVPREKSA